MSLVLETISCILKIGCFSMFDLTAGTDYRIEYWYKSFTATATSYQLELRYGSAATGAAMTNNAIAVDPRFTDSNVSLGFDTFTNKFCV